MAGRRLVLEAQVAVAHRAGDAPHERDAEQVGQAEVRPRGARLVVERRLVGGDHPAPGNKGGTTPLLDVYEYAQRITSRETVGRQVFEEVVAVASGKKSKSELAGVGDEEFAPWSIGPVM